MQGDDRPAWFVGDLDDPWVAAIADRLPASFDRRHADGEIPDGWADADPSPGVVVLHRPILTATDAERLGLLRARSDPPPRVVLVAGPHIRHDDLARWGRLFDAVIPEATAVETIRRRVGIADPPPALRGTVHVISGLHDIRTMLRDACRRAGYRAETYEDAPDIRPRGLVLWDVPVLDPGWGERMARRSGPAAVLALIGFADRPSVTLAREAGAAACLDWPSDLDDLASVLDRLASTRRPVLVEPAHLLPPPPAVPRRPARPEVLEARKPA